MPKLIWTNLLNRSRLSDQLSEAEEATATPKENDTSWLVKTRLAAERDHDRILFSTPVRRLADKTQVFPLERNESIRTRLTHSHEVSNLARSFGTHLCGYFDPIHKLDDEVKRSIQATLAAVGLAHDLGNPPFGHQGEFAIRSWFKTKNELTEGRIFKNETAGDTSELTSQMKLDFLKFEGNAHTLRVVTKLQVVKGSWGLDLSCGTLASLMKYSVGSHAADKKSSAAARKKNGFFYSEEALAQSVLKQTGLDVGDRHPLASIMEACDDIAYRVIDVEDSVKKQLASPHDLMAWLSRENKEDEVTAWLISKHEGDVKELADASLSPAERNDVLIQLFRVNAINAMMSAAINAFKSNYSTIMDSKFEKSLIDVSNAQRLSDALKNFALHHGYKHRSVLELELKGYNAIHDLMDMLWQAIDAHKPRLDDKKIKLSMECEDPFAKYAYSRISENYRRVFESNAVRSLQGDGLPIRYIQLQLLTDMIAGMTDGFVLDLRNELENFQRATHAGSA